MEEDLTRSRSAPPRTSTTRATLSLGNQDFNAHTGAQILNNNGSISRSTENIPTFFIWSILNLIFVPMGILCCFFSHKVSQFKMQNRYEKARKWSKRTFVANIISTLLMIGIIITIVMLRYDYKQQWSDPYGNQTQTTPVYIPWQPGR